MNKFKEIPDNIQEYVDTEISDFLIKLEKNETFLREINCNILGRPLEEISYFMNSYGEIINAIEKKASWYPVNSTLNKIADISWIDLSIISNAGNNLENLLEIVKAKNNLESMYERMKNHILEGNVENILVESYFSEARFAEKAVKLDNFMDPSASIGKDIVNVWIEYSKDIREYEKILADVKNEKDFQQFENYLWGMIVDLGSMFFIISKFKKEITIWDIKLNFDWSLGCVAKLDFVISNIQWLRKSIWYLYQKYWDNILKVSKNTWNDLKENLQ